MPYKDKQKRNENARKRYHKYKEERPEFLKKLKEKWTLTNNSEAKRLYEVERRYGLPPDLYLKMLEEQANCCFICKQPETWTSKTGKVRPLCVDHCHATGKVRRLLCTRCNAILGYAKDNPSVLEAASLYLKEMKGD